MLLVALAGCPSPPPTCGMGSVATSTLTANQGTSDEVHYGSFVAMANNDCPDPNAPAGVVSVTMAAAQTTPAGMAYLTFCLPRPDLANGQTGYHDLQVIDVQAALGNCHYAMVSDVQLTVTLDGFCGSTDARGFSLTIDGSVRATKQCPGLPDMDTTVTLTGAAPGGP